jgi:hypothetical protein
MMSVTKRQPLCGALKFQTAPPEKPKLDQREKAPRVKTKNNPKFVSAARELRDRYLEQINSRGLLPAANGKYDVSRAITITAKHFDHARLLEAA